MRRALQSLADEGLVALRPNRGAIVPVWSLEDLSEVAEVRAHLSVMAGRAAAVHASEEDLHGIERCAEDVRRVLPGGTGSVGAGPPGDGADLPVALSRALLALHDAVFAVSGNRLLHRLFAETTYVKVVHITFSSYDASDLLRIQTYVGDLAHALRARDGLCAGALMQTYFLHAKRALLMRR